MTYEEFSRGVRHVEPSPINTQSIATCTGIPRETVRRKVARLEARGWVERLERGYLVTSPDAAQELAPLTQATLRYLAAVTSACLDTLDGEPPEPHRAN
jgi:predicted transcriptional regulator of viral defense system